MQEPKPLLGGRCQDPGPHPPELQPAELEPAELARSATLRILCDTFVPATQPRPGEPAAFFARTASDLRLPERIRIDEPTGQLLDALRDKDFSNAALPERTALLRDWLRYGPHREALDALRAEVLAGYYSIPDQRHRNPNWPDIGYPGPRTSAPAADQVDRINTLEPAGDELTLTAQVCVVGSGAGGSVIAAELAARGQDVLVVEAGQQWTEADFRQLEHDMSGMYLRGGQFGARDNTIGLLAGSALGGGTVINSMVCLDPPAAVRASWAGEHGLTDVAGESFDGHLAAVRRRLNVNTEHTVLAPAAEPMVAGLAALGLDWEPIARNCAAGDDPALCGYCNAGCQQGAKQSTHRTYLRDAAEHGARFLVGTRVHRILVEHGRAAGVVGSLSRADGSTARVTVRAGTVVAAAGGIETPALLLRSGIGGPAAGHHLRLHPAYFVSGVYPREIRAWTGQIQTAVSFAFHTADEGAGFLVEHVTLSPKAWAAAMDWTDGAAHKREMRKLARVAPWHGVAHDHGSGQVLLDAEGEAVVDWRLTDPLDRQVAARAHRELARIHRAAGAEEIYTFHRPALRWRRGEDFDAFSAALLDAEHEGVGASAHQLGSARMGLDPATSVADWYGQLHDVPGVWVGDASAMPTSPSVNPMITTMALARRTAHAMAATR